jgi:hypothetical protein
MGDFLPNIGHFLPNVGKSILAEIVDDLNSRLFNRNYFHLIKESKSLSNPMQTPLFLFGSLAKVEVPCEPLGKSVCASQTKEKIPNA